MRRTTIIVVSALAIASVLGANRSILSPKLVWNASASVPVGLYRIDDGKRASAGDLVAIKPPCWLAAFLADRGYLPNGALLLKRILAVPGQVVCRNRLTMSVDGNEVGMARERDRVGRALPGWLGCRRIPVGAIFLMNRQVQDSLDGRYFGPLPTDQIIGRAVPLWTDENGDGLFQWRARTR